VDDGRPAIECRQYFNLWFPYDTCKWQNANYVLHLDYNVPGQEPPVIPG
jgi:hypothetical protein